MNRNRVDSGGTDGAGPFASYAAPSHANGYSVIPLYPNQKRPRMGFDWRNACWTRFSADWVHAQAASFPDSGVGLACGRTTMTFDIDIEDVAVVSRLRDVIENHCGTGPLVRVGRPPRVALIYRSAEPIVSMRIPKIDVLGLGTQLAAYGIHPTTGRTYDWVDGIAPHNTPLSEIPAVTNALCEAAISEIVRSVYGDRFERMVFDLDMDLIRYSFSSRSRLIRQLLRTLARGKVSARDKIVHEVRTNGIRPGYWGYVMRPQVRGGFDSKYFLENVRHGDPVD